MVDQIAAELNARGIKTAQGGKWRKRQPIEDQKTGPKEPRSTVLSEVEEAMVVAFRRNTLPPLNGCLYAPQPSIQHLPHSSLHRCLDVACHKPKRQKFKRYPIGNIHIDTAELRTREGKLHLFVAIDRTRKFAFAQLVNKANRKTAREFLEHLLETVMYKIHTILTDNVIQSQSSPETGALFFLGPCASS